MSVFLFLIFSYHNIPAREHTFPPNLSFSPSQVEVLISTLEAKWRSLERKRAWIIIYEIQLKENSHLRAGRDNRGQIIQLSYTGGLWGLKQVAQSQLLMGKLEPETTFPNSCLVFFLLHYGCTEDCIPRRKTQTVYEWLKNSRWFFLLQFVQG